MSVGGVENIKSARELNLDFFVLIVLSTIGKEKKTQENNIKFPTKIPQKKKGEKKNERKRTRNRGGYWVSWGNDWAVCRGNPSPQGNRNRPGDSIPPGLVE